MQNTRKAKLIVILGPTSSGKSDVAIKLAKKFNGEIISADSRQIFRKMDVGTGKIHGTWNIEQRTLISEGIPHYGIDIVNPETDFNAAKFKKYADKIIPDILASGKIPILCGGTGFWIKSVADNIIYPEVKPDWKLRNLLRNKTATELFKTLKKLDPERAKNIDVKNKVRLIRAIEICKSLGKVPAQRAWNIGHEENIKYDFLQIGINIPKEKLQVNIKKRLKKRFTEGMIEEVEKLHFKDKIRWKRLEIFGLGYALIPKYLKGEIGTKEELFEKIFLAEKNYAKRQMTWFKKDKRIIWLEKYKDIENKVKQFIK